MDEADVIKELCATGSGLALFVRAIVEQLEIDPTTTRIAVSRLGDETLAAVSLQELLDRWEKAHAVGKTLA